MNTVYFFFAPPRSGNHWIEMMLSGLYNMSPLFLTNEKGNILSNLEENYGSNDTTEIIKSTSQPHIPEVTKENPVLFLEYNQKITNEVVARGEEIDLDIVRSVVRSSERGRPIEPLHVQWFHGEYHSMPFFPKVGNDINMKFWCVKRSPQAMAYSLFKVKSRWSQYSAGTSQAKSFLSVYSKDYLRNLCRTYQYYDDLQKIYSTSILIYEDLLLSEQPLIELIENCVQQESKLSPHFVWQNLQFNHLTRGKGDRSFYRKGSKDDWVSSLTRSELKSMESIEEEFDFTLIGYPSTRDIMKNRTRKYFFMRDYFKKV